MDTKDCFAYKNRRCLVLTITKCQGMECPFYKTAKQAEEDEGKAMKRILSLDEDLQNHINKTYYGGKMGGNLNEG